METQQFLNSDHSCANQLPHIVFGGGISRALVADVGVLKAARQCGLSFASIGGISAGAVMPLLDAAGMPIEEMQMLVLKHNLSDFLRQNFSRFHLPRLIWRVLNSSSYERTLPSKGLYSTEKLADFIESYVTEWPEKYWTMAYTPDGDAQIIFTKYGVFKRSRNGDVEQVDKTPAPIGLAIRATCAVPGFFDSVTYVSSAGAKYELFDGFISWDGYCPAPFVESFFGAERHNIIACDVIQYKTPNRLLDKGYMAVLTPNPPFAAHTFKPTLKQKLAGTLSAFNEAEATFSGLALSAAGIFHIG